MGFDKIMAGVIVVCFLATAAMVRANNGNAVLRLLTLAAICGAAIAIHDRDNGERPASAKQIQGLQRSAP